jgi:NADPH:quinone reductase-like Zn-dependent oxidoreductase
VSCSSTATAIDDTGHDAQSDPERDLPVPSTPPTEDLSMEHSQKVVQVVATPDGAPTEIATQEVELLPPGDGQVQVQVRAAGMNPADLHQIAAGHPRSHAQPVGFEASGVVIAVGAAASTQQRPVAIGDEVIAYLAPGAYASHLTVPATDVFPKPANLSFSAAANLFLVGLTAAELLEVTRVSRGDTVVVHGASGATGVSVLQQARLIGARVIGTASEGNFDLLRRFGAEPVTYGPGLEERLRYLAPGGVDAALDCVGTEEALVVSTALVADRGRTASIANSTRSAELGIRYIVGSDPASYEYRNDQRQRILDLAAQGKLEVPVARTFALAEADQALELLRTGHPGGKLALIP